MSKAHQLGRRRTDWCKETQAQLSLLHQMVPDRLQTLRLMLSRLLFSLSLALTTSGADAFVSMALSTTSSTTIIFQLSSQAITTAGHNSISLLTRVQLMAPEGGRMLPHFQIQITTRQTSSQASELVKLIAMILRFGNYEFNVNLCVSLRSRPPTALRR